MLTWDVSLFIVGHDFPQAAHLYSEAIEKNPYDATLYCNRAYARLKIEEHGYALADACAFLPASSFILR